MVPRIALQLREPNDLLRICSLALDNGAHLTVTSACVKADAATVKMASNRSCRLVGNGCLLEGNVDHLKGRFENKRHRIAVEYAASTVGIVSLDTVGDHLRARDDDLIATARPKQGFYNSLNKVVVFLVVSRAVLIYVNGKYRHQTVVSLESDRQLFPALCLNSGLEIAIYKCHRHKAGIQGCINFQLHN